jgi:hypothetical protein
MRNVVVTGCPRADLGEVGALTAFGVATVHEAIGRTGYLGPGIRPVRKARADTERASRAASRHGELGLDRYGLRAVLAPLGVEYVDYQSYQEASQ